MELIGERFCNIYDYNGDEFHCLFKCLFFKKLDMQKFISRFWARYFKMDQLFNFSSHAKLIKCM